MHLGGGYAEYCEWKLKKNLLTKHSYSVVKLGAHVSLNVAFAAMLGLSVSPWIDFLYICCRSGHHMSSFRGH